MAAENEETIDEKPATHNKKAQQFVFIIVTLVLLGLGISSIIRMNSGTKLIKEEEDRLATDANPDKQKRINFEERYRSALNAKDARVNGDSGESYEDLVARLKRELFAATNDNKKEDKSLLPKGKSGSTKTWADEELKRVRMARYDDTPINLGFKDKKNSLPIGSKPIKPTRPVRNFRITPEELVKKHANTISEQTRVQEEIGRAENLLADIKNGKGADALFDFKPYSFKKGQKVGQTVSESPKGQPLPGQKTLPIGTVIRASIDQRVISDYLGSLRLQITHDVYDLERRNILIPAGSICVAKSLQVTNINEAIQSRVGYIIKDLRLPNGTIVDFSRQAALDREGVGAVSGDVNYHFMAQFLGVAAYALVANSSSYEGTGRGRQSFKGQVSEGLRDQGSTLAQKYLSLVPTITLESGTPVRIFIEESVFIYPWASIGTNYEVSN